MDDNRRYLLIGFGAAALLGVGAIVALLVTGALDTDGDAAGQDPAAAPTATAGPLPEMTSFRDPDAGIALEYPAAWETIDSTDPQVRLIATPDRRDSLLVRVVELNQSVDGDDIAGVREFTRSLVMEGTSVELLAGPEQVEVAGLPGWFYLYRFHDDASGDRGAHSHYFLFEQDRMIVLVFQALPADGFADLAPVFDHITSSVRLLDGQG